MRELLEDYRAGRLRPVPIQLGPMPAHARPRHRAIAADIALRIGLMRADGDDRPLPYACSEAVREGHVENARQANDAIQWLMRHGVIAGAGVLQRRPGMRYGTRRFTPPSAAALERQAAALTARGTRPDPEPREAAPGDLIAALIEAFDAKELPAAGEDRPPGRPPVATSADGPCRYAGHRGTDWRPGGGPVVCGVCHPAPPGLRVEAVR